MGEKLQGDVTQQQVRELLTRVKQGEQRVEGLEQRVSSLEANDMKTGWVLPPDRRKYKTIGRLRF